MMKYLKWFLILMLMFIASILVGPFYVLCCWIDRDASERFLDLIGEGLKNKMVNDLRVSE